MVICEILVPLLNANEPEARLVSIHVKEGQHVKEGALLFSLETTKAATDLEASASGFVRLLAHEGDILAVGGRLAVLTQTADEPLELAAREVAPASEHADGIRITKPARELAEQLNVDLSKLPAGKLITESVVREFAGRGISMEYAAEKYSDAHILVYGGGGHAKSLIEMLRAIGRFQIAGIVDDAIPAGSEVLGIRVLGRGNILGGLASRGLHLAANGVGGILDIQVRVKLFDLLHSLGYAFPALVHPRATVELSAQMGEGVQVFANAYVGSQAVLEPRCMVNTGAVVSHDCEIGAYSHIAPGALLAGHVRIGERTLVGMGVTTVIGTRIGAGVRIGNGAIINADVPDKTIIPAGKVWSG